MSVRVLVSHMAAFEVLVAWEYMLALKVNMLGVRRLLTVTSTLLLMQYLKWVCCNLVPYNYISLLIEDILSNSIKVLVT